MKRILLLTEGLGSGGAERQFCGLAAFLKNKGYKVVVVTYTSHMFYLPFLQENSIDYVYCPFLLNKFLRPFRLLKLYRKHNPDVLISFLQSVNMGACLSKLFWHKKLKLIVSERNTNQNLTFRDKILFSLYKKADYIVPNSFSQKKFILNHYPKYDSRIKVITNFVDSQKFSPFFSQIKNSEVPSIVTVARYAPQKNCIRYMQVISELKKKEIRVHFSWYGDMNHNKEYFEQLTRTIFELNISDYISLYDQTSNIIPIYQTSDIFCLPSLYEGFPNALCEAMSCGLPVLCSDVCDNRDIVEDTKNGFLFDPTDVDDMVYKIQSLLSLSTSQRNTMGEKSREISLKKFSIEKFTNQYISLIEKN